MTPARLPGLPASLDQITARLLAKDPAARPASAAAARAGLLAALAPGATAVLPVPPGSVPGTPRRWRRRRGETVLAAALAATLAALAAVLAAGPGSARPAAPAAHPAVTGPASHDPAGRARQSSPPRRTPAGTATAAALPPVAAAAAALVGDLQAGVADGQVAQQSEARDTP